MPRRPESVMAKPRIAIRAWSLLLDEERKALGLPTTGKALAKALGVSRHTVTRWSI